VHSEVTRNREQIPFGAGDGIARPNQWRVDLEEALPGAGSQASQPVNHAERGLPVGVGTILRRFGGAAFPVTVVDSGDSVDVARKMRATCSAFAASWLR